MITNAIITSLVCVAVHNALVADGMLLKWLGDYIDEIVKVEFIKKPLFKCLPCMASVWGTGAYLFAYPQHDVIQWLIFVLIVSGINKLIQTFIYEL